MLKNWEKKGDGPGYPQDKGASGKKFRNEGKNSEKRLKTKSSEFFGGDF